MGVVKKIDRPELYPGRTVWGRTSGPVVYVGDVEQGHGNQPGISVFLDERESREVCAAWGWLLPEQVEALKTELELAQAEVARLEQELEVSRENQVQVVPLAQVAGVLRDRDREAQQQKEATAA